MLDMFFCDDCELAWDFGSLELYDSRIKQDNLCDDGYFHCPVCGCPCGLVMHVCSFVIDKRCIRV